MAQASRRKGQDSFGKPLLKTDFGASMYDAEVSNYFSFNGYPGYALIDKGGEYRPGAIQWMSTIENRDALAALIK